MNQSQNNRLALLPPPAPVFASDLGASARAQQHARANWIYGLIASHGERMTEPRRAIVHCLTQAAAPVSIKHLAQLPELLGHCDLATIYRTLMWLVELGAARELRFTSRSNHFVLTPPGSPHDYLICEACGAVTELPCDDALDELERRLAASRGFVARRHQFEIYGVCGACRPTASSFSGSGPHHSGCTCCRPRVVETSLSSSSETQPE